MNSESPHLNRGHSSVSSWLGYTNVRSLTQFKERLQGSKWFFSYLLAAALFLSMTALMASADRGWTETAKLLIASGAQIDAKTTGGYTALMSAVWSRDVETVQALVDAGADLSLKNNKGETALTIAQGLDEKGMIAVLRAGQIQKSQSTLESMKVSLPVFNGGVPT